MVCYYKAIMLWFLYLFLSLMSYASSIVLLESVSYVCFNSKGEYHNRAEDERHLVNFSRPRYITYIRQQIITYVDDIIANSDLLFFSINRQKIAALTLMVVKVIFL